MDLITIRKEKDKIREEIWRKMEHEKVSLFPGAWGKIPNFKGRERAAEKVLYLSPWKSAQWIKSNPDSPQQPLRERALLLEKVVYMAVPRLREERCFIELLPWRIKNKKRASTIKGAFSEGKRIYPEQIKGVDIIIAGSVVVNYRGERIGKGGGFSDLEYAILRELKIINESTPVITTVHEIQVVDYSLPRVTHDILVDYIITPERIIKTRRKEKQPSGIIWNFLTPQKIENIPFLKNLRKRGIKSF